MSGRFGPFVGRFRPDRGEAVVAAVAIGFLGVTGLFGLRVAGAFGVDMLRVCAADAVAVEAAVAVEGRAVTVTGATNLPDGAVLASSFWQGLEPDGPDGFPPHPGVAIVRDGRFTVGADLSDYPEGVSTVALRFVPGRRVAPAQPPAVVEAYGRDGGCLEGDHVVTEEYAATPRSLAVLATFSLPPRQVAD